MATNNKQRSGRPSAKVTATKQLTTGHDLDLLRELSEAAGVPGCEDAIRAIVDREVRPYVDAVSVDPMGNLIAFRQGSASQRRKVMFAAHMDEIGFYVSSVDSTGFLRLQEVGGFDTRTLFARRVLVHAKGGVLRGVLNVAGKALHVLTAEDRKATKEVSDFFVDLGLPGKQVSKLVRPGDMVTLDAPFVEFGGYVSGKCLDNRAQVFVGIRALQQMKAPKNDIYGVFTVQEEVGLRGAVVGTYGVNPDIGICLDTTVASDVPGVALEQRVTALGKGVAIKVLDGSVISDRALVYRCEQEAKRGRIAHQFEILPRGGTDAGAMQRSRTGVKTVTLSIPTRYLHTVTETLNKADLQATRDLLVRLLEGLTP
jgi:endoglucanase